MTGRTIEIIVLIVLIVVTAYFWNKSKKQAQKESQKETVPETESIKIIQTVRIEGMMCPKCCAKVTEALGKFGSVEVNLEEKTATITSDELCDEKEIEQIITELGFSFEGMVE